MPARTSRSSRCGRSAWSRSATTTWRSRGSGTPRSSSGGGWTASRARAPTPSWRSRSASTSPRSCAGETVAEPKVVLELAGQEVAVSNPSKVYFPRAGVTKLEMVRYYLAVAPGALGGVRGRPMALKRFVNGAEAEPFFQKRAPDKRPGFVQTVELSLPAGRTADEVVVTDEAALAWVINLGCIDLNPHPVRAADLDHPDELRVDLDPVPGVQWPQIRDVAMVARDVLADYGLTGWPKTSGALGIHIYARIEPAWAFGDVRRAAVAVAREIERRAPQIATPQGGEEGRHGVLAGHKPKPQDPTGAAPHPPRPGPHP